MAPCKPKSFTAGSNPVLKFDGAFEVAKHPPPPNRTIHLHVKIHPSHPRLRALDAAGKKPPTHFHPAQWEYFHVLRGSLTVEIDGTPRVFTSREGEFALPPGPHHCLYATPGEEEEGGVCEFWLGASEIVGGGGAAAAAAGGGGQGQQQQQRGRNRLDQAFFENWYGYQEDVMLRGVKPDAIQVLCMFDAGNSYLSPPAWVPEPLRSWLGYWAGVVVGRWIGGLLGYQPFHAEWTSDWEAACEQMKGVWSQRWAAVPGRQEEVRRGYLARGESVGNEGLWKS